MLLSIGTRVRFIKTGDVGVVTELLGDGMVNVLIDGDMEIPAFDDDIIRIEDEIQSLSNKPPVKAKIVPAKQEKKEKAPIRPDAATQYTIIKSAGIQLAFEADFRVDGIVSHYNMFLINDTRYAVLYSFSLSLEGLVKHKLNGKLDAISYVSLGEFKYDSLNDSPSVSIECWQITTEGTGSRLHKDIKIKAKQFFNKVRTAPLINKYAHLYKIFEKFDKDVKEKEEDLKTYTKINVRPSKHRYQNKLYQPASVNDFANFRNEIDLHIESLRSNFSKMSNAEILRLQLQKFDEFLNRAIELGVQKVYIIHGVGKGRLRDEIASRLIQNPDVITFKNEFHPRYGYGATEVLF